MSKRAQSLSPAAAAAEAVKSYIRIHREELSRDGELLALLLPERFAGKPVHDLQRHVIDQLRAENTALKSGRDRFRDAPPSPEAPPARVRSLIFDLLDARSFEETLGIAVDAAEAFGAAKASLYVEAEDKSPKHGATVRIVRPGTAAMLLRDANRYTVLKRAAARFLGETAGHYQSAIVFRLQLERDGPPLLYALWFADPHRPDTEVDLCFFADALERSFRAWLDLPKV
ncbi:MAG: hypothetical protein JO056_00740 [Alphaproteobacteria bacterium]|nr:hypothetical protein [Alphaproteobacteria bacterium]